MIIIWTIISLNNTLINQFWSCKIWLTIKIATWQELDQHLSTSAINLEATPQTKVRRIPYFIQTLLVDKWGRSTCLTRQVAIRTIHLFRNQRSANLPSLLLSWPSSIPILNWCITRMWVAYRAKVNSQATTTNTLQLHRAPWLLSILKITIFRTWMIKLFSTTRWTIIRFHKDIFLRLDKFKRMKKRTKWGKLGEKWSLKLANSYHCHFRA